MIYNYSSVFKRENKIYEVGGITFGDGIKTDRLKIMLPILVAVMVLGHFIGNVIGFSLINIFKDNFSLYYTTTVFILGILVGVLFYDVKISTIRLYEYLFAYFKPRKYYTNENHIRHRIYKQVDIEINSLFRSIL